MNEDLKTFSLSLARYLLDGSKQIEQATHTDDLALLSFAIGKLNHAMIMAELHVGNLTPKSTAQIAMEQQILSDIAKAQLAAGLDVGAKITDEKLNLFVDAISSSEEKEIFDYKKLLKIHLASVMMSEGVSFVCDAREFGATQSEYEEMQRLAASEDLPVYQP